MNSNAKTLLCWPAALVLSFLVGGLGSAANAGKLVDLPRNLEVELALSALPETLRTGASIYVLDPEQGYVLHRTGENGFVTFVGRTSVRFYEADWSYDYPSDQIIPIAFDSIGAETHIAPWFDIAKMRAEGLAPEIAKQTLRDRFDDGAYEAPRKGGLSYMLAPIHRAYLAPDQSADMITVSMPHYMPYAPYVTSTQLGNSDPTNGGAFALNHGGTDTGPHGYVMFMVPIPQADEIRGKYAGLLEKLCGLHANWCLKASQ